MYVCMYVCLIPTSIIIFWKMTNAALETCGMCGCVAHDTWSERLLVVYCDALNRSMPEAEKHMRDRMGEKERMVVVVRKLT